MPRKKKCEWCDLRENLPTEMGFPFGLMMSTSISDVESLIRWLKQCEKNQNTTRRVLQTFGTLISLLESGQCGEIDRFCDEINGLWDRTTPTLEELSVPEKKERKKKAIN